MRQQVNLKNVRNQTPKQRMIRIKQKIKQRKQKLIVKGCLFQQNEQSPVLQYNIYQEKALNQKLKNRQAAQKSREQKKKYIESLQEQVKHLNQQLSRLKYCEKCQLQLNINYTIKNLQFQENYDKFNNQNLHQNSHRYEENEKIKLHDSEQISEQNSQYMRISSTHEQSSIGIYLFICMIMLGIFCMGSRMGQTDIQFQPIKRDLQSFYAQQNLQKPTNIESIPQYDYSQNMKSTYSTIDVPQLINMNQNDKNSLMSMQQAKIQQLIADKVYYQSIINSFESHKINQQDKNLRSKLSVINHNKSLLFCSRPIIYKSNNSNNEGILTAFIDIFVKGAEIINIFSQNSNTRLNSNKIQLNGLYKISASVEQIQQIGNSNFIY